MQSKVSLAAALLHDPQTLILDEPFNGLDFIACQRLTRLLRDLAAKGRTILITSHQFDLLSQVADNFGLLINGRISQNVTITSLMRMSEEAGLPVKDYIETKLNSPR